MAFEDKNRHFSKEIEEGGSRSWSQSLLSWAVLPTTLFILPIGFAAYLWRADRVWTDVAAVWFGISGFVLGIWSLYLCGVPMIGGAWTRAMPAVLIVTYLLAVLACWFAFGWLGLVILLVATAASALSLVSAVT